MSPSFFLSLLKFNINFLYSLSLLVINSFKLIAFKILDETLLLNELPIFVTTAGQSKVHHLLLYVLYKGKYLRINLPNDVLLND